jgi:hypothetical protein
MTSMGSVIYRLGALLALAVRRRVLRVHLEGDPDEGCLSHVKGTSIATVNGHNSIEFRSGQLQFASPFSRVCVCAAACDTVRSFFCRAIAGQALKQMPIGSVQVETKPV